LQSYENPEYKNGQRFLPPEALGEVTIISNISNNKNKKKKTTTTMPTTTTTTYIHIYIHIFIYIIYIYIYKYVYFNQISETPSLVETI